MESNTKTTPVTLDDVRTAIEGIDPNLTNASAVRKTLGRGSNDTIQRHLTALRAELAAQNQVPADATDVPAMPSDAMQVIWASAYTTATAKLATRLAILSAERDSALLQAATALSDLKSANSDVDAATEAIESLRAEIDRIESKHAEKLNETATAAAAATAAAEEALKASQAETTASMQDTAAAFARGVEIQHLLDLEKRDRETEKTVLHGTIDRLNQQVSDLKTLLAQLSPAR